MMMSMQSLVLIYSACCVLLVSGYTPAQLVEMRNLGLRDIQQETIDGKVTVESGAIPKWLAGNFLRHACAAYGQTEHRNATFPNYITHLFGCYEMGQKFRLEKGEATFTNRWYDTTTNDIYNYYDRDMNQSSNFRTGVYSKVNKDMVDKWAGNMSDRSKVSEVPAVSWWQVGGQAIAMTESPIGVVIDPETVTQQGYIEYLDDNLGTHDDPSYQITNNPAHEHTDPDGTLWSTVAIQKFLSQTELSVRHVVYKVGADRVRHVVGEYDHGTADLSKCSPGTVYPDLAHRFGYMHSFSITENYVVLPETAYMFDPCVYTHHDKYEGFFAQSYRYEENGETRLLVMRRTDGHFIANITMPPFFVTHQFGSYEDGEMIHMDMLTYDDAHIYTEVLTMDFLLQADKTYTTNISRISINMTDFTATMTSLRSPDKPPAAFEMSNINYAYNGKKYTYGYMVRNFNMKEQNAITKINMDTSEEMEYLLAEGMFVQEPVFIATPGSHREDDGVILAQGFDGRKAKGFLVVVNATDMTLVAHVTAPDMANFGLHNRFYPLPNERTNSASSLAAMFHLLLSVAVCYILYLVA